jgi:hypothetical protein
MSWSDVIHGFVLPTWPHNKRPAKIQRECPSSQKNKASSQVSLPSSSNQASPPPPPLPSATASLLPVPNLAAPPPPLVMSRKRKNNEIQALPQKKTRSQIEYPPEIDGLSEIEKEKWRVKKIYEENLKKS